MIASIKTLPVLSPKVSLTRSARSKIIDFSGNFFILCYNVNEKSANFTIILVDVDRRLV